MILQALLVLTLQDLTEKTYEKIRDDVLPSANDLKFEAIPWQIRLWDAIVVAQKEDKPILLYAMNGHPMANT